MWTTDEALEAVRRKTQIDTSSTKLSSTQLLTIMYEELLGYVYAVARRERQDYWTASKSFSIAANVNTQRVWKRAIAGTLEDCQWIDASGNVLPLRRFGVSDRPWLEGNTTTFATGIPSAYVLEGDLIYLYPRPNAAGTLRVRYERRPSKLVAVSACGLVSSKTSTTLVTSGGTFSASDVVDVVQADPDFDMLVESASVTYAAGTFTFSGADLSAVAVGDYVCNEGETCVVPLPDVLHPVLVKRAAQVAFREIGDVEGAELLAVELEEAVVAAISAIQPRARKNPLKSFQKDSPLRIGRRVRGYF